MCSQNHFDSAAAAVAADAAAAAATIAVVAPVRARTSLHHKIYANKSLLYLRVCVRMFVPASEEVQLRTANDRPLCVVLRIGTGRAVRRLAKHTTTTFLVRSGIPRALQQFGVVWSSKAIAKKFARLRIFGAQTLGHHHCHATTDNRYAGAHEVRGIRPGAT